MENKQAICDALCETLKLTRGFTDLQKIEYTKDAYGEWAYVVGPTYSYKVNVALDSGIAMIKDILRKVG